MGWGYIDEEPSWRPPTELPNLKGEIRIAIDTETYDPHLLDRGAGNVFNDGCVIGISMAVSPTDKWYCPIKSPFNDGFAIEEVREWADRTFNDTTVCIGANLMYDIGWLDYHGINIKGATYDVQWVEALINEHKNSYSLDNIALDYGLGGKDSEALYKWCAEKFGGKADGRQRKHMHEVPLHLVGPYAEADAALPLQIADLQQPQVEADGLEQVVDLEHRLMPMLLAMRKRGVRVNMKGRQTLTDYLDKTLIEAKETVRRVAGREVNVNAAADIAKVFDSNGWDYPLTAKAQKPSFTKGFLTTCDHEFGKAIAAMRRLGKMKTTFVDGYFGLAYNGRIHSNLHPLRTGENGTVSGRLSSSSPNNQNLPSNDKEFAPLIRGLFVPDEGERWVCLDFSQIEYRLLAHYALGKGADKVRQQYNNDPDTDFHKLVQDATGMERKAAKCIAEGQLVLTDKGLVPIQKITCCHRLWDGVEWVNHEGVIFMGTKEVITYDGLTATPDHGVWTNEGRKIDLGMGAATHARLIHSGRGAAAIKLGGIEIDPAYNLSRERQAGKTGTEDTSSVRCLWETPHYTCVKHQGKEDEKLQVPARQVQGPTRRDIRGQISGDCTTVPQGHACEFDKLSWEGHKVSVQEQRALHKMGDRVLPRGDIQGEGVRQDRQQRALRGGQSAACDTAREPSEQTQHSEGRIQREDANSSDMGIPLLCRENNLTCIKGYEWRGDDTAGEGDGAQKDEGLASGTGETKTARVYDIVNAGPRSRFTVSGVLVKNCLNFGIIYGQGIDLTAESLGVDRETAAQFRNEYYARAPYVKATSDAVMNRAQNRGWIKTIMGRRARFTSWEPSSFDLSKELGNFPTREEALKVTARHLDVDIACTQIIKRARTYKALNALLQGSAADLMKKAMVDVWESGVCDVLGAPLLTVHDELDWSKPQTKEGDEAVAHAAHLMCNALPEIKVPVLVDCEEGDDWGHIE